MVDFTRNIQGGGAAQFQQTRPTVDASESVADMRLAQQTQMDIAKQQSDVDVGGAIVKGITSFASAYQDQATAVSEARVNASLGSLATELSEVVNASETDPTVDVQAKQRQVLKKFRAANPELALDADKVYRDATGRKAAELTRNQQMVIEEESEAFKKGFITANDTPEERTQGMANYEEEKTFNAQTSLMTARSENTKAVTRERMPQVIEMSFRHSKDTMDSIYSKVQNGEMNQAEAKFAIGQLRTKLSAAISSLGEIGAEAGITSQFQFIKDEIDVFEGAVSGKYDREAANEKLAGIKTQVELNLRGNPNVAHAMAIGEFMGPEYGKFILERSMGPGGVEGFLGSLSGGIPLTKENAPTLISETFTARYGGQYDPVKSNTPPVKAIDPADTEKQTLKLMKDNVVRTMTDQNASETDKQMAVMYTDSILTGAYRNIDDLSMAKISEVANGVPTDPAIIAQLPPEVKDSFDEFFSTGFNTRVAPFLSEIGDTKIRSFDPISRVTTNNHITEVATLITDDQGIRYVPKNPSKLTRHERQEIRSINNKMTTELLPYAKQMSIYYNTPLNETLSNMTSMAGMPTAPPEEGPSLKERIGGWFGNLVPESITGRTEMGGLSSRVTPNQGYDAIIARGGTPQEAAAYAEELSNQRDEKEIGTQDSTKGRSMLDEPVVSSAEGIKYEGSERQAADKKEFINAAIADGKTKKEAEDLWDLANTPAN